MCSPHDASTMFRTANVFFVLLLRSNNFQKFTSIETSIEHFRRSNGHLSSSWRLLQPTARIAREMCQGSITSHSPSLLDRVSAFVVLMDVLGSGEFPSMSFLTCTGKSFQLFHSFLPTLVRTPSGLNWWRLTLTITARTLLMFSQATH